MKIADIEAYWISVPIPTKGQWRSDYGRLTHFDMCLVKVITDDGRIGIGEAKAAVGATGSCASIVACIKHELKPKLIVIDNESKKVVSSWGPRTEIATRMIKDYKEKHGKVDDTIKKDLQVFYNNDKGKQIEKEMISLLSLIVES